MYFLREKKKRRTQYSKQVMRTPHQPAWVKMYVYIYCIYASSQQNTSPKSLNADFCDDQVHWAINGAHTLIDRVGSCKRKSRSLFQFSVDPVLAFAVELKCRHATPTLPRDVDRLRSYIPREPDLASLVRLSRVQNKPSFMLFK